PSHRKMKDKFVRWDNPPTLDGMTGHAGCLPNCKCWAEVHIPDPQK
ncbi:TPA: phage minor head protein, partial [Klebsiella pneumoniae]